MGGSGHEHEHGGYGGTYPPPNSLYPPQPGAYGSIPYQDRSFEAYPPTAYPPPPQAEFNRSSSFEKEHHHHHHHGHHHDHGHHHGHEDSSSHHRQPQEYSVPRSLVSGQTVKLHCQANMDYHLTVDRHSGVVLLPASHNDQAQLWIKDMSWSTKVKDKKGFPAFALVNKATNQALKHTGQELQQVSLADYNPAVYDESVLWTESEDMGNGFRTIRMATNIELNLDAYHGDKRSGGIKDRTPLILFKWKKQENQLWKMTPCD